MLTGLGRPAIMPGVAALTITLVRFPPCAPIIAPATTGPGAGKKRPPPPRQKRPTSVPKHYPKTSSAPLRTNCAPWDLYWPEDYLRHSCSGLASEGHQATARHYPAKKPPDNRIVISRPVVIKPALTVDFLAGELVVQIDGAGIYPGLAVRVVESGLTDCSRAVGGDIEAPEVVGVVDTRCSSPSSKRSCGFRRKCGPWGRRPSPRRCFLCKWWSKPGRWCSSRPVRRSQLDSVRCQQSREKGGGDCERTWHFHGRRRKRIISWASPIPIPPGWKS